MMYFPRKTFLALSLSALAACGGGGGSGGNAGDDAGRNTGGSGNNVAMGILQEGLYEYSMYYDWAPSTAPSMVNLSRTHLTVDNGNLSLNEEVLDYTGWRPLADYYDENDINESRDLILTATGWVERGVDNICSFSADAGNVNAAIMTCQGNRSRIVLTALPLGGTLVSSALQQIADREFSERDTYTSDADSYQGVIAATQALSTPFSTTASAFRLNSTSLDPELVTLDCAPTADNQPVSEWTCRTDFTSTSWAELDTNDESFSVRFIDQDGQTEFAQAYLDGDLVNATSGNIVVTGSYENSIPVGTVLGQWQKLTLHGQNVIRLLQSRQGSSRADALVLVNNQIVQGLYEPAGSTGESIEFNEAAANVINEAVTDIFPLSLIR